VSVEVEPALAAVIAAVPSWAGHEPSAIDPIGGGITNRNFRVDIAGGSFVVRLWGTDTELLGIDRAAENEAICAAAEVGVAPEVVAFLPEQRALVTRFVDARPISEDELQGAEVLGLVVASLRRIHSCPPIAASFPVFRMVEDYRRVAVSKGVVVPAAYDDAHAFADRIEAAFGEAPTPSTTCHNDLLNANFLLEDGHVWIVDYEYAGMGDPFFDLGNLSINNAFSLSAQAELLSLYFGEVADVHRARLALMRLMSDFREAMWGVVQQGISTLEFDYVDYARRHFARCLDTASDDRFDNWLDAARVPVPAVERRPSAPPFRS
jgi:thiamine kinase-like enzyme